MEGKLAATNNYVDIEWSQRARQIEKGYTYENRLAELTYKITVEGTDYLSANKNDEKEVTGTPGLDCFQEPVLLFSIFGRCRL